jgi:hypothetical protein
MQIQDGVNPLIRTEFDDTVQMLKPRGFEDARVHVVLEVVVIEGNTETIQSEGFVELCVCFREEVVHPFVEEEVLILIGRAANVGVEGGRTYFSCPRTLSIAARCWFSWPG